MTRPRGLGRADPWALTASVILLGLVSAALFGERLAPHEAVYFVLEHEQGPRPFDPGLVFPLGSDVLGRDLLSLVLAGARATLTVVLLAGLARVLAGVLVAAVGSWWRPTRLLTASLAELVSAVPATLVALIVVRVFVRADTSVLLFVGALVLMGWAGPYRVIRAEVDRLAHSPFTEGARVLGVTRWRLFWRHQLPHLVPVIAMNLSQQVVASLVLVAELGVLSAFVGTTRVINVEESLSLLRPGPVNSAVISDTSEWGGLLASSRSVEALWVTRWLILVPGAAFALTAVAVATMGFALARRYARRDLLQDLRGPGALALGGAVLALFVVSGVVPERYAAAREWAAAARADLRPVNDVGRAFGEAGLRPVADGYAVERHVSAIVQTGPATARIGPVLLAEQWPTRLTDGPDPERNMRSFVSGGTGGGLVEGALVFAGRGISARDHQPVPPLIGAPRTDVAALIREYEYADDYEGIDVRGKVVVLVRFVGIRGPRPDASLNGYARGPLPEDSIAHAIRRGAAAVIFIDPSLSMYNDLPATVLYRRGEVVGGHNPYLRAAAWEPPTDAGGVPVVVVSEVYGAQIAQQFGIDLAPLLGFDVPDDPRYRVSPSRDLGITARVEVPLRREAATTRSYLAEVTDVPDDAGRIVVWSDREPGADRPAADVVAALARTLGGRGVPFVFVVFDPSVDPAANARAVRDALGHRRIALLVVLDRLEGSALRFTTPHGDLVPALDLYAEKAAARHETTRLTAKPGDLSGVAPFPDVKTVLIRGQGGQGDLRGDAAALIGYLAGRLAFGAEEVPR